MKFKKEIAPIVSDEGDHGSPGWIRTNNQVINSHLLCQLSYQGSENTSGPERYRAIRKLSTRLVDRASNATDYGHIRY